MGGIVTLMAEAGGRTVGSRPPPGSKQLLQEFAMSRSVKQQVIEDLQMAGLAPGTQKTYLAIIVRFVNCTRTRPQDATEAQVAEYLHGLIRRGLCQGTISPTKCALQFIFQNTLRRDWALFKKGLSAEAADSCVGVHPNTCSTRRRKWVKLRMPQARHRMARSPRLKPSVRPLLDRLTK